MTEDRGVMLGDFHEEIQHNKSYNQGLRQGIQMERTDIVVMLRELANKYFNLGDEDSRSQSVGIDIAIDAILEREPKSSAVE